MIDEALRKRKVQPLLQGFLDIHVVRQRTLTMPLTNPSDPRVCKLVRYYLSDIIVNGAWSGPAAPAMYAHALAPLADLPVLAAVSGVHIISDLPLGPGEVVRDYLQD